MFKKGDVVRCLVGEFGQFTEGKLYEVREDNDNWVSVVADDRGDRNGWAGRFFEVVVNDNSPVRTVTRREIVPFTMNAGGGEGTPEIRIKRSVRGGVDIGFGADRSDSHFNANSLRSAGCIFNEIADVLDEQSAEVKKEAA